MNALYFILPLSTLFALGVIVVFIRATLAGQFDDLETPPYRMLMDDDQVSSGEDECK